VNLVRYGIMQGARTDAGRDITLLPPDDPQANERWGAIVDHDDIYTLDPTTEPNVFYTASDTNVSLAGWNWWSGRATLPKSKDDAFITPVGAPSLVSGGILPGQENTIRWLCSTGWPQT